MPNTEDTERVDRLINQYIHSTTGTWNDYNRDATFHHNVNVARQVLYVVAEAAREVSNYQQVDLEDQIIEGTIRRLFAQYAAGQAKMTAVLNWMMNP